MDTTVKTLNTEKAKALQAALAQIEKQFGKGAIMRLGEGEVIDDIEVVSTGSLGLDIALGVGGLPRGRVVEIYGPESSGKTTLTLQVIAEMQKLGGTCAFIDAEHALDIQYAQKLGVNLQELLDQPARHGRAGARDRRRAGALGLGRPRRHRLGRRAHAQGRDRRRDGRFAARPAGAPHEPGAAQAHRLDQEVQHHGHLHQPDPHEDRRHVRLARNHHRRQRAQVLRLGPARHPPHRLDQEGRGSDRQRDQGEGRQEQGRAAVQDGRVRHPLRPGHQPRRRGHRHGRRGQDPREERLLVRLQRREDRPGQGQRARVPEREPRAGDRDREQGSSRDGHSAAAGCGGRGKRRPSSRSSRTERCGSRLGAEVAALQLLAQRDQSRSSCAKLCATPADAAGEPATAMATTPDRARASMRCSTGSRRIASSSGERFVESRVHAREARFGNLRIKSELAQHGADLAAGAGRRAAASELAARRRGPRAALRERHRSTPPNGPRSRDSWRRAVFRPTSSIG